MPRTPRAEQFDPNQVGIVHLIQRCVRRSFLTGFDETTGKDYSHRREWIRTRLERLASVFGIDILTYAILSNHLHVVVRTRPDVIREWSDKEVALRWLRIFPGQRIDEHLADPTTNAVDTLANDADRIKLIRVRLSDPSWFMKALCEPIARLANFQDKVTGHFWEGRFKAQAITDEAGLLACSMYVDLNPIRAAMAATPEDAIHTSAYDRIKALEGKTIQSAAVDLVAIETEEAGRILRSSTPDQLRKKKAEAKKKRGPTILRDAWLSPLTLNEREKPGAQPSNSGVRASDKGFLWMKLADYLRLLNWTSQHRFGRLDNPTIPKDLEPILKRIGINGTMWCDLVWNFKKYFGRASAAGSPNSLKESASNRNRKFAPGQNAVAGCFTSPPKVASTS
jgi:REP element-mobilizing transposase RayT